MTIPRDVGFGLNDFQEMQVYSEGESIARYLSNILLMRPGNLPGLPHIGLNVKQLLYDDLNEFNATSLKEQIYEQCSALLPHIIGNDVYAGLIEYNGTTFLLIRVSVEIDSKMQTINYAFYQDELREIKFDFQIDDDV